MLDQVTVLFIIAVTACFSRTATASNHHHVITMNPEDVKEVAIRTKEVNPSGRDIEFFWARVEKNGPFPDQSCGWYNHLGQCWSWSGNVSVKGRPVMDILGESIYAHRVSWVIHFGVIPKNLFVLHDCDNKLCVNPEHLHLGTIRDNNHECDLRKRRTFASGDRHWTKIKPETVRKGARHHKAKLNDEAVIQIRARLNDGEDRVSLAKEYGVTDGSIWFIQKNKTWRYLL